MTTRIIFCLTLSLSAFAHAQTNASTVLRIADRITLDNISKEAVVRTLGETQGQALWSAASLIKEKRGVESQEWQRLLLVARNEGWSGEQTLHAIQAAAAIPETSTFSLLDAFYRQPQNVAGPTKVTAERRRSRFEIIAEVNTYLPNHQPLRKTITDDDLEAAIARLAEEARAWAKAHPEQTEGVAASLKISAALETLYADFIKMASRAEAKRKNAEAETEANRQP